MPTCKYFLLLVVMTMPAWLPGQSPAPLPASYPNSSISYVRTWDAAAPEQNVNSIGGRPLRDVKQTTVYVDGLGRPLQTVFKEGSFITGGNVKDLVTPVLYDANGRESLKYLPFGASTSDGSFKLDPFLQQVSFYNTKLNGQAGETNVSNDNLNWAYGQTVYEASPLDRAAKTMAPGANWVGAGRGIENRYWMNTVTDGVLMWTVTPGTTGNFSTYSAGTTYPANVLYKNGTVDEHGKQVIAFTDKEGKVILKKVQLTATADDGTGRDHTGWLCTYYVYDDFGNLSCVIQPEGVKWVISNGSLTDATVLAEQCFRYEYDNRNRMIMKQVPGAQPVYMVYDARDRLVMIQDGNLRALNKWMVTLYDNINRPVQTGLLLNTYNNNTFLQHLAAAYTSTTYPFTTSSLPVQYEWLTETGYDDYSNLPGGTGLTTTLDNTYTTSTYLNTTYNSSPDYAQQVQQSTQTRGLVTWSRVKVLSLAATYTPLYTVNIYDEKQRLVQVKTTNVTGGKNILTTQYNWDGLPIQRVEVYERSSQETTTLLTRLVYDDLGRVLQIDKKLGSTLINSGTLPAAWTTVVKNQYDALGQVKNRQLGNKPDAAAGTPLARLDYDYNVRGWLLSMNKDFITDVDVTDRFFGMELGYDKNGSLGTFASQYNGNIGGTIWKSAGDQQKRKFDYSYDAANRITAATFNQYVSGTGASAVFNKSAGLDFDVSNITYDANGNIQTMQQKGWKLGGSATIDNLQYNYLDRSNRLKNVIDANNNPDSRLGDFKTGQEYLTALGGTKTTAATDYDYDANGNLKLDQNKAITSIIYNHLNLPAKITLAKQGQEQIIYYTYDALGNKLIKDVQETTLQKFSRTQYIGPCVYTKEVSDNNAIFRFAGHEEGRVRYTPAVGASPAHMDYDYFIRDHLGNVRMVLTEERKTTPYMASMDLALAGTEEPLFDKVSETRYPVGDVPGGYPTDNSVTNPNTHVSRTNGSDNKIGPSLVLKVMSGDKVSLGVKYFYRPYGGSGSPVQSNATGDILASLADGIVNVAGTTHGTVSYLSNTTTSPLLGVAGTLLSNSNSVTDPSKPRAYLNWILLDEQFNPVNTYPQSGALQVGAADLLNPLAYSDIPVTKSGYLYIYVSNETENWNVFFDNLAVTHTTGALLEETHYYPFGSIMAGISSKAFWPGGVENKRLFNGKELQSKEFANNEGLDWYDYGMREYDPLIGRFFRIDPITESFYYLTPYQYASNDPVLNIDLDGLEGVSINSCEVCVTRTEKKVSESTTIKPKPKPGARYVKQQPVISVTLSRGKQVGFKVGSLGAEYNGGSQEMIKWQDDKPRQNSADRSTRKRGYSVQVGVFNVGKEIEQKTEVKTEARYGIPFEQTTYQITNSGSVGLKGGFSIGAEVQETYIQNGSYGALIATGDRSIKSSTGWSQGMETSGKVNGLEFGVSLYFKVEVKFDLLGMLNSFGIY